MKLSQLSIIFVIVMLAIITVHDTNVSLHATVIEQRQYLNRCFHQAIDEAVDVLVKENDGTLILQKEQAVQRFFYTMYASLGILSDAASKEQLQYYFPVIGLVTEEGMYLYYQERYQSGGTLKLSKKQWSEFIPFTYEDEHFIYHLTITDRITIYDKKNELKDKSHKNIAYEMNVAEAKDTDVLKEFYKKHPDYILFHEADFEMITKEAIVAKIEEVFSNYMSLHNEVARNYGVAYEFQLPRIDTSEWLRSIKGPSLFVLFQGYPIMNGTNETYSEYSVSAATINKKSLYYVEKEDWYYLYHKESCPGITKKDDCIVFYDRNDCAAYGAYACPVCHPNNGGKMPVTK